MQQEASSNEKGLWIVQQMDQSSPLYNCQMGFRFVLGLDELVLKNAVFELVARYPNLRVSFVQKNDSVVKVLDTNISLESICKHISRVRIISSELEERIRADARIPFNLSHGPLFRCFYYHNDSELSYVSFVFHHIICDGASLNLFEREFTKAIERNLNEKHPPLGISFSREMYSNETDPDSRQLALDYWKTKLERASFQTELPVDKEEKGAFTGLRGRRRSVDLSPLLLQELRRAARREGVSLSTIILAGYYLLLNYYGSGTDLVVGVACANRSDEEQEQFTFRASVLPIRLELEAEESLFDVLKRVHRLIGYGISHCEFDFLELVRELNPPRIFGVNPLFQSVFTYQYRQQQTASDRTVCSRVDADLGLSRFPLSLRVTEFEEVLSIEFEYSTDHFSNRRIEQLFDSYEILLRTLTESVDVPVSALCPLSSSDRNLLESYAGQICPELQSGKLLHELFEEHVQLNPDRIAISAPFESSLREVSFGALDRLCNQFANFLVDSGFAPNRPIALLLDSSLLRVVAMLGTLKAGGFYVPLPKSNPEKRSLDILKTLCPAIIIHDEQLPESIALRHTLLSEDLLWEMLLPFSDKKPTVEVCPEDNAYIIYTSGSSGIPKGVEVSHRSLVNHELWFADCYAVNSSDSILQRCPYFYDGSINEFFSPLISGACLHLSHPGQETDTNYLISTIERNNITFLTLVPSVLENLISNEDFYRCKSLRVIICGGEQMPHDLPIRLKSVLPAAQLHNLYGPTECTINVTAYPCASHHGGTVPIGKPIWNTQLLVLDEFDRISPLGIPGELNVGGYPLAKGYYAEPNLTRAKFKTDTRIAGGRLYQTGDLVQWDTHGNLLYLGRKDRQIKLSGHRIEPGEIECHLRNIEGVNWVSVMKIQGKRGNSFLVAFFLLASHSSVMEIDIRDQMEKVLPLHMVPQYFISIDTVPFTPAGKVDVSMLSEIFWNSEIAPRIVQSGLGVLAVRLSVLIEKILGFPLGLDQDFFLAGGRSVHAIQIVSEIRQNFQSSIDLATFYRYSSIEKLTSFLQDEKRKKKTLSESIVVPRSKKIIFIHTLSGEVFQYLHIMSQLENDFQIDAIALPGQEIRPQSLSELADRYIELFSSYFQGHYSFVGWSFGGVLAHLLAARLEVKGLGPEHLFMLDSRPPGFVKSESRHENCYLLDAARIILREVEYEERTQSHILENMSAGTIVEWFLRCYQEKRSLTSELKDILVGKLNISAHFLELMDDAPTVELLCKTSLLAAQYEKNATAKVEMWRGILHTPNDFSIPATHYSIVEKENAPLVAGIIRQVLASQQITDPKHNEHIQEETYETIQ